MSISGFIGWVRGGHPRDAGGTPQKVKSAKRGDSDSESESEQETVAQRRLREHEELHGPRASAVVEGGAGASMEVEVLRNEADPVLVRLNGNEVIQYPDDQHVADDNAKNDSDYEETGLLGQDEDGSMGCDDDASTNEKTEVEAEVKTKGEEGMKKESSGVRVDHPWTLVKKSDEAEKGDWPLFLVRAHTHNMVNWENVRSGSWGGVYKCCLHVNCGKLIRVVNDGDEGYELYECYEHGYIELNGDRDCNESSSSTVAMIVEEVTEPFQVRSQFVPHVRVASGHLARRGAATSASAAYRPRGEWEGNFGV